MSESKSFVCRLLRHGAATVVTILGVACATTFSGNGTSPENSDATLYRRKCGSCHSPFPADSYSDGDWEAAVKKMAPRAVLTATEHDRILRWLKNNN